MNAAPAAVLERGRPVFEAVGQGVEVVGEDPAAANIVKIAGNFLYRRRSRSPALPAITISRRSPGAGRNGTGRRWRR